MITANAHAAPSPLSPQDDACPMPGHGRPEATAPCCRAPVPADHQPVAVLPAITWTDTQVWKRAAKNTMVCLVGCSIGDVGVLVLAQAYWPHAPMLPVMMIAILAGLATSMILETVILRLREGFPWSQAVRTAASMSLLSMIAMEVAMNLTDFALTDGNRMMSGAGWYAAALGVGALVGFLVPLPYNYWMLKRHGRACH